MYPALELFLNSKPLSDKAVLQLSGNPNHDERGRFTVSDAEDMTNEADAASKESRDSVEKHKKAIGLHKEAGEAWQSVAADAKSELEKSGAKSTDALQPGETLTSQSKRILAAPQAEINVQYHKDKIREHERKIIQLQKRHAKVNERNSMLSDLGIKRSRYGGYE